MALVALLAPLPGGAARAQGGGVAQWIVAADRMRAPLADWRGQSVLQLAMHDALNAAGPRYARWLPAARDEPQGDGAHPEVALHAAAHAVLVRLNPDWAPMLARMLGEALERLPGGPGRARGIALGEAVARAHLAADRADVPQRPMPFTAQLEKGRWRPTPPGLDPGSLGWQGRSRLLALPGLDAVSIEPPAVADAQMLARDLAEVRRRGRAEGSDRTDDETEIARFWAAHHGMHLWPRTLAAMVEADPPGDLWRTAWALSVAQAVLHDVTVAGFAAKERLGVGRPVTAIHEGWDGAARDPGWEALVPTPAHPEYPAGHGMVCSAAVEAIALLWRWPPSPLVVVAETGGRGVQRIFHELDDAAEECAEARVLVGAHYRSTMEASDRWGRAVARAVVARAPGVRRADPGR